MSKLFRVKKILAFMTSAVITVGLMSAYSSKQNNAHKVDAAQTISEIQEERKQNEEKISELESQLDSLEKSKSSEEAYQSTLSDQIDLLQENLRLLDNEITQINADITAAEENIAELDASIASQQEQVDANIELFKERLCAMYVSGNDSLISAVLGSTDFYDMLSRVEMVSNIAAHDEELVDTLLDEITTLDNTKSALETEKLTLEMNKSTYEQKKEEMKADMTELSDKMQSSQEEMDRIALEADILNKDKSALESENSSLDDLYEEIQAQIKKDNETKAAAAKAETTTQAATSASTTDAAQKVQEATKAQTTEAATEAQTEAATEAPTDAPTEAPTEAPVVEEETEAPAAAETEPTYVDTSTSVSGFAWPAPASYYISSGFGSRWGTTHRGIDIAGGVEGTSAVASKSGTVISVNNSCVHNYAKSSNCCGNGYGNYVIISHDDGTQTLYGHLASANVSVGEYVSQGQVVGTIGSTGYSTGFHLHFEIYVDGVAVDPQNYVP